MPLRSTPPALPDTLRDRAYSVLLELLILGRVAPGERAAGWVRAPELARIERVHDHLPDTEEHRWT